MITIATWNVNSIRSRLDHLKLWLDKNNIDILCLQETKVQDADFPTQVFSEIGFQAEFTGQKSYNGVCTLFNNRAKLFCKELKGINDEQKRLIAIAKDNSLFVNIYVPNGSSVGSEKFHYKLKWLDGFCNWITERCMEFENIFLLGDFNIAPDDLDVHDPDEWKDKILCTRVEREYIHKLKSIGFIDLFRYTNKKLKAFSWWDYRAASFRRNRGLRIDLILAYSKNQLSYDCWIDPDPRGWEKPSDHTPVLASIEF